MGFGVRNRTSRLCDFSLGPFTYLCLSFLNYRTGMMILTLCGVVEGQIAE